MKLCEDITDNMIATDNFLGLSNNHKNNTCTSYRHPSQPHPQPIPFFKNMVLKEIYSIKSLRLI